MEKRSVETIVKALNEANVRYLIVGGLAVVAHGYVRFTADVDLFINLEATNLRNALGALTQLGYLPRAPVKLEEFADTQIRQRWISEKGMKVFSLSSSEHAATEIDLFAQAPFDFDDAYACAARLELSPGLTATFVDLDRLITLKNQAGRPQDLIDIKNLKTLRKGSQDDA